MSKQAFHQKLKRHLLVLEEMEQLLVLVKQIRENHPRMSSRQMYRLLKPAHLGRDRFEAFCTIAWNRSGLIGVQFDEPIPKAWVIATRDLDSVAHLPNDNELDRRAARDWVHGQIRI